MFAKRSVISQNRSEQTYIKSLISTLISTIRAGKCSEEAEGIFQLVNFGKVVSEYFGFKTEVEEGVFGVG